MTARRFRVALSFAGEKREFVAQVADILAQRFGEAAILYDKYHAAEFSRGDLAFHLSELYANQSDLVVAVLSPSYESKEWCGLEWSAIFGLLKARRPEEVMLTRFGLVEGTALHKLAGYTDLDDLTPDQAATLILERLAVNEGKPKDHYTRPAATRAPAATSTPNNLPRLQPFFGRENELATIREALDPESRTWGVLIDGPGGMGKTSLAIRAAYDCPPDLFERIIFVSVKDREMDDDGERKLTGFILPGFLEMLNELARELKQADITKAPEDQRIRLLLDALRPMRALLILDNLESLSKDDRHQLLTFVKRLPQGCKAILTSRRRIGSGSELLILEDWDEEAALDTLAELSEHNKLLARTSENERRALVRQTGGNPLLLRWVAGQLGRGSCRTLSDALAFLRTCPPENDPLEFIFGDLAREFTDDETRVLAALSFFTLPARVKHIANLLDLNEEPVEIALRTLTNRSLVVPDQEEINYALVPMVADFLRRSRPNTTTDIGDRLTAYAYRLMMENGHSNHDLFPVLEAAWPILSAALPFFSGANSVIQAVCNALDKFLDYTGRWDEQLSLLRQAEIKALEAGDLRIAGWRAYDAGYVHTLRLEADLAVTCANRAAAHWDAAQADVDERATAILLRGAGYHLKGSYASAVEAYDEALSTAQEGSTERRIIAVILNDRAHAKTKLRDIEAAEQDYREALRIAQVTGDSEMVAGIPSSFAKLAIIRKDWHEAEVLASESLMLCEKIGRQELIAGSLLLLAIAVGKQGRIEDAVRHARRAAAIAAQFRLPILNTATSVLTAFENSEHSQQS